MIIYNLPNDFSSAGEQNAPVIIRSYQSRYSSKKNKSILHQNMVDMLISGQKTFIDIKNTKTLEAGEIMILSKGNCLISEALPKDGLFSSVVIYFTNEIFSDFLIKYQDRIKDTSIKSTGKESYFKYKQDSFIRNYIHSLIIMLQSETSVPTELKKLKLEELLLYLLHKDASLLGSLQVLARHDEDMKLRMAAENNIANPVTVEELAFLCNNSVSTFKRRFNKIYGTSPQKWLQQQKMKLAADMLKHPDDRAGVVYEKVGYKNHSSFSMAFKQQYGLTPKEYRDKNLNL